VHVRAGHGFTQDYANTARYVPGPHSGVPCCCYKLARAGWPKLVQHIVGCERDERRARGDRVRAESRDDDTSPSACPITITQDATDYPFSERQVHRFKFQPQRPAAFPARLAPSPPGCKSPLCVTVNGEGDREASRTRNISSRSIAPGSRADIVEIRFPMEVAHLDVGSTTPSGANSGPLAFCRCGSRDRGRKAHEY
jgi:hypothetical protein